MKKIIIAVAVIVIAGVAAFVVVGGEPSINEEQMEKMRGTEAYYIHSEEFVLENPYGEGEIMTNLMDGGVVKLKFDVKYKIGLEWGEDPALAIEAFTAAAKEIRSELFLRVRGKDATNMKGPELLILKQEIIDLINDIVFPKQMGRVTNILVTDMFVQTK